MFFLLAGLTAGLFLIIEGETLWSGFTTSLNGKEYAYVCLLPIIVHARQLNRLFLLAVSLGKVIIQFSRLVSSHFVMDMDSVGRQNKSIYLFAKRIKIPCAAPLLLFLINKK